MVQSKIISKNIKNLNKAFQINSILPYRLKALKNKKQKIFHFTTDGVFNGIKGNYKESDIHNNSDLYSLTKSMGEVSEVNFFNIRCSIIGNELNSCKYLFNWFISRKNNSIINGYSNHIWNGLTTKVLSRIIVTIIKKKINLPRLIHLIPKDKITKYDLLCLLKKIFNKRIKIRKYSTKVPFNRSLSTIYKKKNSEIWNKTFKKKLSIRDMLKHI